MDMKEIIQAAIETGRPTGFITFDQLNELCPMELGPLALETLMAALIDEGIQVTDDGSEISDPSCSFCGKTQPEVLQLIAGADGFVCSECVQLCVRIISNEHPEWLAEHRNFVNGLFVNSLANKARDGKPPS